MQEGIDYATTNLLSASYFTGAGTGEYTQEFFFNSSGIALLQAMADETIDNQ